MRPALWLVVDAALAATVAWPAEALLLFLLSPDLPFTPRGFVATMIALGPQVLCVFVLAGPALVVFANLLSVSRTTREGVSIRYVLRFGLLDMLLLSAAAMHQFRSLGALLPDLARSALGLTATALLVGAAGALALVVYDLRRPGALGAPSVVALALAVLVPLAIAGDLRRVRLPDPRPLELPGFEAARRLLVIEVPGLDPRDLEAYATRGNAPALEALLARGSIFRVDGAPVSDPVALHATLITGNEPLRHGILGGVRYRATTGTPDFAMFPRGLFLRPLLATPLWERVPIERRALRAVELPAIARALGLRVAVVGDPFEDGAAADGTVRVFRDRLRAGAVLPLDPPAPGVGAGPGASDGDAAGGARRAGSVGESANVLICPDVPLTPDRMFDPPADDLPDTPRLAALVGEALAEDACALAAARALFAAPDAPGIVFARLGGHARVAWQFAGWRPDAPARAATDLEIRAYQRTMTRYVRALDPAIAALVEAAGPDALVALVSPLGVRPRQGVLGVGSALFGRTGPTGTFAGPPPGLAVLAGPGVRAGQRLGELQPLTAVLPTLLWAVGLPTGEDMGPIVRSAFDPAFADDRPLVTVPTFNATAAATGH